MKELLIHVDAEGNALLPVGEAFRGQDVSIVFEIGPSHALEAKSPVRPARKPLRGEAYMEFVASLAGSRTDEIPEPPDPPSEHEDIFLTERVPLGYRRLVCSS